MRGSVRRAYHHHRPLGGALNAPALCCIQFGVAGLLALGTAFLRNEVVWEGVLACWPSLLYVGVASGALGYTLQIAGQRYTEPTLASLILCLESVFGRPGRLDAAGTDAASPGDRWLCGNACRLRPGAAAREKKRDRLKTLYYGGVIHTLSGAGDVEALLVEDRAHLRSG